MNEDWQDRQRHQHDAALWTYESTDPPEEDEDDDEGNKE